MATARRADMFIDLEDDPREDRPRLGDERATLVEALREVLVGMIEEYARHLGHADLLRADRRPHRPVTQPAA